MPKKDIHRGMGHRQQDSPLPSETKNVILALNYSEGKSQKDTWASYLYDLCPFKSNDNGRSACKDRLG